MPVADHFKLFEAKRQAEFLEHVRPEFQRRRASGAPMTCEEYDGLFPMNSYERHHLTPLFDDELLAREARHYFDESSHVQRERDEWRLSGATYDEVLVRDFVPMLIDRLRARGTKQAFNLNDELWVKLTERGRKVLRKHLDDEARLFADIDAHVFGPAMCMGAEPVCDMNVTVTKAG